MMKKVLIACEFSGVVRDAFIDKGFNAISKYNKDDDSWSFPKEWLKELKKK